MSRVMNIQQELEQLPTNVKVLWGLAIADDRRSMELKVASYDEESFIVDCGDEDDDDDDDDDDVTRMTTSLQQPLHTARVSMGIASSAQLVGMPNASWRINFRRWDESHVKKCNKLDGDN
jgi:hypothetical protein